MGEWVGWVPLEDCGKGPGNLDGSHVKISNLKIEGSVVQGPTPRTCSQPSPRPSPSPSPTPTPGPAPPPSSPTPGPAAPPSSPTPGPAPPGRHQMVSVATAVVANSARAVGAVRAKHIAPVVAMAS